FWFGNVYKGHPPDPATPVSSGTAAARPARPARSAYALVGAGALALFLVTAFSPSELIGHFTVFVLAIVIGFYVIGQVHHALHTPLMSVTNAISGIVVVGALLQIGHGDTAVTVLSFAAILLASINVFGGFAVTRRMLGMFSKG
ncbi:proton-translocating transhydrogenase family protein, partial [Streptomyces scabiei]|uniref:proton-translocating transhydrogenase family protein n=1 Tax=Streptomyces scabiei TaxID=1930 RepID=UPI0029B2BBCE